MISTLHKLALSTKFTETALLIEVSSVDTAREIVIGFEEQLANWAKLMSKAETIIRANDSEIRIPASIVPVPETNAIGSSIPDEPSRLLWFANVAISPVLLRIANDLLESQHRTAIIRLADERQILMTNSCGILVPGRTLQQATTWQRNMYWHPQDLDTLRNQTQQQSVGSSIEVNWRSFDPILGPGNREPGNWLEFATRFTLIDGEDGYFYHVCDNLGMREIEPVSLS